MESKTYIDSDKNTIRLLHTGTAGLDCSFKGIGIQFVVSGNIEYNVNCKKFEAFAGDYIIGNHHTLISKIKHKKPAEILCVEFSAETINRISEMQGYLCVDFKNFLISDRLLVNRYSARNTELEQTLIVICDNIKSGVSENHWLNSQLFQQLGKIIIAEQKVYFAQLNKINLRGSIAKHEVFRSLHKAKSFIDNEYLKTPDLGDLCESAGISRFYFCRLFKLVYGIPPYQYLKHKKLELARKEIISGKTIAEVGFMLGFSDVAAFSKSFKQFYGFNPGELKKIRKIKNDLLITSL